MDDKLDRVCRERGFWATAAYPGLCWILENVLKVSPEHVAEDGFSMDGAKFIMFDMQGKRIYNDEGLCTTYREWTDEEKALLAEWEEFIPDRFKGIYHPWTM